MPKERENGRDSSPGLIPQKSAPTAMTIADLQCALEAFFLLGLILHHPRVEGGVVCIGQMFGKQEYCKVYCLRLIKRFEKARTELALTEAVLEEHYHYDFDA